MPPAQTFCTTSSHVHQPCWTLTVCRAPFQTFYVHFIFTTRWNQSHFTNGQTEAQSVGPGPTAEVLVWGFNLAPNPTLLTKYNHHRLPCHGDGHSAARSHAFAPSAPSEPPMSSRHMTGQATRPSPEQGPVLGPRRTLERRLLLLQGWGHLGMGAAREPEGPLNHHPIFTRAVFQYKIHLEC